MCNAMWRDRLPVHQEVSMRASGRWAMAGGLMLLGMSGCRHGPRPAPAVMAPATMNVDAGGSRTPARPTPAVAWSAGPFATAAVPPRDLAGVVVDDESGMPVALAQISIRGGSIATLTDSTGRFRMVMPNATTKVWVRRIGYVPYSIDVVPRPDSGLVLTVALQRARIGLCQVSSGTLTVEIVGRER